MKIDAANEPPPRAKFPIILVGLGIPICVASAVLAARLIWEQTVWTYERGPQMIGFSLAHGPGAMLFIFPAALLIWFGAAVVLTVRSWIKRNRIWWAQWIALSVAALLMLLLSLPEGFWERVMISRMAASPHAADLLVSAAVRGDFGTVKAFLAHGVKVNSSDRRYHRSPLGAAAAGGDLKMIRFLVSQGADVNALDRYGDSPLELAASHDHDEAAKFLSQHGALRARGTDEQRQKATEEQVQEVMREMYGVGR